MLLSAGRVGITRCGRCSSRCPSNRAFRRLAPGLTQRDVYLCGPPGLASAVRDALRGAGLPEGQLHEERFAF